MDAAGRMTGATLKTVREALGLPVGWLAAQAEVQERTVRYWEAGAGPVPADVQALVQHLEQTASRMIAHAVTLVRAQIAEHGLPAGPVVLVRYSDADDLRHYRPDLTGLPPSYHAAALARVRWALADDGVPVEVRALDPQAYEAWLRSTGQRDSEALRAHWVAQEPRGGRGDGGRRPVGGGCEKEA